MQPGKKTIAVRRFMRFAPLRNMPSPRTREWLQTMPSMAWLAVFVLIPSLLVLLFAFRSTDAAGGIGTGWTLEKWGILAQPATWTLLTRTLWISLATSLLCLLLALPVAWCITHASRHFRNTLLLLVIVPFWTNFLIRVFAWNQILHSGGMLAEFLRSCQLLGPQSTLLHHPSTVVLVSVHTFLPFAILPLYAATEKFDFGLLDAARDLGATPARAFRSVFLPGIRTGIITALLMVFIPMLGSYVIPDLVGGTDGQMIGNKIAQRNFSDRDMPSAAVLSSVLSMAVFIPLLLTRKKSLHSSIRPAR